MADCLDEAGLRPATWPTETGLPATQEALPPSDGDWKADLKLDCLELTDDDLTDGAFGAEPCIEVAAPSATVTQTNGKAPSLKDDPRIWPAAHASS